MKEFLWVSHQDLPPNLKQAPFRFQRKDKLPSETSCSVVIFDELIFDSLDIHTSYELTNSIKILFTRKKSLKALSYATNHLKTFTVLDSESNTEEISQVLHKAHEFYQSQLSEKIEIDDLKRENKKLLSLKSKTKNHYKNSLSSIEVAQNKTKDILNSKKEISNLTKRLSGLILIDDFFKTLEQELRVFHDIHNLYLIYTDELGESSLMFSRKGHLQEKNINIEKTRNEEELRKKIADTLKKPIRSVKKIDLLKKPYCTILLEHSLNQKKEVFLSSFLKQRISLLKLTFQRVLLQTQIIKHNQTWSCVFDVMREPLCITKKDGSLIHHNKSFGNFQDNPNYHKILKSLEENLLSFSSKSFSTNPDIMIENKIFQIHSFPIKSKQDREISSFVNHYVDVTQSRKLYTQMLQTEKMTSLEKLGNQLAHELNNPLTGIRSMAQILLSQNKDDLELKEDLESILESTKQCHLIIQNLLDFAKESADLEEVSLKEIVEKTIPLLKSIMASFEKDICLDEKKDIVEVQPQLIQQVIFNLIKNASESMTAYEGSLEVTTEVLEEKVRFSVKDSGSGIHESSKDSIFEPLFTTKKKTQGTGIGLYLCKMIIEKSKGHISYETKEGEGSTFYFELPKKQA